MKVNELCRGFVILPLLLSVLTVSLTQNGCIESTSSSPSPVSTPPGSVPTIKEMFEHSDVVVAAKVLRNRAEWVGRKIYTFSEIEILDLWKGGWEATGEIQHVAFQGGTVGEINLHVTHEATLREKEVAVLFLVRPGAGAMPHSGVFCIYSEHGKIRVSKSGEPPFQVDRNRRLERVLNELDGLAGPRRVARTSIRRIQ